MFTNKEVHCYHLLLWFLTPLSKIFQLYLAVSFVVVETEEISDQSQVADKLYHIMLHRVHLAMNRVRTHNFSDDRY